MARALPFAAVTLVSILAAAGASAAPAFCPTSSVAACSGRQTGDLLITLHGLPPNVLGLNAATRTYYVFSTALSATGASSFEITDIAALPSNPQHTVVIGNTDNGLGIRELDGCGNLVPQVFGHFPDQLQPPLPPYSKGGLTNRGLVFNPITGDLVSPGLTLNLLDGSGPYSVLFTFPPTGGTLSLPLASGDLVEAVNAGAVAADAFGSLYLGHSFNTDVSVISGSSILNGAPVEHQIPTSGLSDIEGMVHDAKGHLFVTGDVRDANGVPHGQVWRVDVQTGQTQVWATNHNANLGNALFNSLWGITIDNNGDLWVVEQFGNNRSGVIYISGETGTVYDYYQIPELVGGQPAADNRPAGIAVLGVNLPAVRESCKSSCPAGQIKDCTGACKPAAWLGDGFCDNGGQWANFQCWARNWDTSGFGVGDCAPCPDGQVPDCNGICGPRNWIGDNICDTGGQISQFGDQYISYDCDTYRFDETTCSQDCGWGAHVDCNGNCAPYQWLGDGVCDNGGFNYLGNQVKYDCAEYDFDINDCH